MEKDSLQNFNPRGDISKKDRNKEKVDHSHKKKKILPWDQGLSDLVRIIKQCASRIKAFISTKCTALLNSSNADVERLKEYSVCTVYIIFGFLMGIAVLPQGIRPLGIAAMCAASDKKSALFTYIGCAFSCVTYGGDAMWIFVIYFMLYAVRKAFTEGSFSEKIPMRLAEGGATSVAWGIIRICTESNATLYSYIALVTSTCIAVSYTYFFGILFYKKEYEKAKMSVLCICSYALYGAVVLSFDNVYFMGIDVQLVVGCFITLCHGVINGFLHGGTVGFICGIASGSPVSSACLGLGGMVCSFLVAKSVAAAVVAFVLVFFSVALYITGLGTAYHLLQSVVCGSILFFPLCGLLPKAFRLNSRHERYIMSSNGASCLKDYSKSTQRVTEALYSVSDIFSKLSERLKNPSPSDVGMIVERAFLTVCQGCALCEMCYARRKTDMEELKQSLFSVLKERPVEKSDYGRELSEKCIRLDSLADRVNLDYKELVLERTNDNKIFLLGEQYSGMARLIKNTEQAIVGENKRDIAFEKHISVALKDAQIPFMYVQSFCHREKITKVHGISVDKIPFGATELKKYLSSRLGIKITTPEFDISEKSDCVMSFRRGPALHFEYAQHLGAKNGEEISGDTVNFFYGKQGYFRAVLCDGMGSGREAAVSSRLASLFLEKMLDTGAEKGVILELLGNALMSRPEESFSTVDLFEADTITGKAEFVKAGAAPSYVIRKGKLYKIFSATLPIGIVPEFTSEVTRFEIKPGDVIIMISDGVVQNNEDTAFLARLIKVDVTEDASEIARKIAMADEGFDDRRDDVSLCVIKAYEEK